MQRVTEARVVVEGETVGEIRHGLLALVAVHAMDTQADLDWTAGKLVSLRIFRNGNKHFDQDVRQVGGSILLVSNFTVAGETRQGRRPSLSLAAPPAQGQELFERLVTAVRALDVPVETGRFGADMKVSLLNDGPVTFLIDSRKLGNPTGEG